MKKYHKISPFLPSRGTHVKGSTCNVVKGEGLKAFTLVEILVSMTIFSMIMVSVIMIYAIASDISAKYDITREMRQNIKSVVEDISEEVRKNGIVGVSSEYKSGGTNFKFESSGSIGTRLKLIDGPEYRLVEYEKGTGILYSGSTDFDRDTEGLDSESSKECTGILDMCTIVKFDKNGAKIGPLSNSKVSFTNLSFNVTGSGAIPKVTLKFTARAAVRSGLRAGLAEKTKLIFQTTFSERALKIK